MCNFEFKNSVREMDGLFFAVRIKIINIVVSWLKTNILQWYSKHRLLLRVWVSSEAPVCLCHISGISDYKIDFFCCFPSKYAALRRMDKDLIWNQDNVYTWNDISIRAVCSFSELALWKSEARVIPNVFCGIISRSCHDVIISYFLQFSFYKLSTRRQLCFILEE